MTESDQLLRTVMDSFKKLQQELDDLNANPSSAISKATTSCDEFSPPETMSVEVLRRSSHDNASKRNGQVDDSIIGDSFYESDAMLQMLPFLKKSIKDLRQESIYLLNIENNTEELKDVLKRPPENISILHLLKEDRKRVGNLIKELADAKQTIYNLQSQILEEREEHKIERNKSMKKLDAFKERIVLMKANEKKHDKEHVELLKKLEQKFVDLSDITENSFKQETTLKTELAGAAKENRKLREELSSLKETYLQELIKKQKESEALAKNRITDENMKGATGEPYNYGILSEKNGKRKINQTFSKNDSNVSIIVGQMSNRKGLISKDDSENENEIKKKNSKFSSSTPNISSTSVQQGQYKNNTSYGNLDEIIRLTSINCIPPTPPLSHDLNIETADESLLRELFFKF